MNKIISKFEYTAFIHYMPLYIKCIENPPPPFFFLQSSVKMYYMYSALELIFSHCLRYFHLLIWLYFYCMYLFWLLGNIHLGFCHFFFCLHHVYMILVLECVEIYHTAIFSYMFCPTLIYFFQRNSIMCN